MGGKTQQRVAGNVKPSSSGRIRDLLINKHGVGNIITFSALASSNNKQPEKDPITRKPESEALKNSPQEDEKQSSPTSTINPQVKTSTSPPASTNKPALVLKRVGNRDYFTRVTVPHDSESPELRKSGVFKPPSFDESFEKPCDDRNISDVSKQDQRKEQSASDVENPLPEEDTKSVYDFDETLDQLAQIRDSIGHYNISSLDELVDDNMIALHSELIRLLKIMVNHFSEEMSIEEWDLVITSVQSWTGIISKSNESILNDEAKVNFCINVLDFINVLLSLAKVWKESESDPKENFSMRQSLLDDWGNFYSSNVYQDLIILYFRLASKRGDNKFSDTRLSLLEALSRIVIDVDPKLVISNTNLSNYLSEDSHEFDSEVKFPENSVYCNVDEAKFPGFKAIRGLLTSHYRVVLVSAHSMLSRNMKTICENVKISRSLNPEQDDIDSLNFIPPASLMSILTSRDSIMSVLLSDYQVGDISVAIDPDSESYVCTLTYLLVWDLVIQFIVGMDKEIGHKMIHCLKKLGLLPRLLDTVFMLLPPLGERNSLSFDMDSTDKDFGSRNQKSSLYMFLKVPLALPINRQVNEIELIALHLYFSVASHMPVTVRKWYNNNSNKRLCKLVNEYTVKHISSVICSLEMDTVQEKCQERADEDKLNNLVIKARPNAREVYAVYTRDEFRMELTIKLPANYPLGTVQIDGGRRVGVTDLKWRSWLLQLTTFLSHQNGPILDGIDLWRRNIDKRFEGIEKCMICFSILHSNYQLPKKKCQTCTKMFHNLCLYKWFESSGNSTCPLCRNTW